MRFFIRFMAAIAVMLAATIALAQSEYRARPGDTLLIEVLEDPGLNRSVVILPDGRFSFPFAGTLRGGGRTVSQIEASIAAGIASNFTTTPNVFVALQPKERLPVNTPEPEPETIDVYFLGEVNAPGLKPVKPGTTFLQAIAQSGGLTKFAATKRIQLRSTNPTTGAQTIYSFNYKALSDGGRLQADPVLNDGDVILVPERRLFE